MKKKGNMKRKLLIIGVILFSICGSIGACLSMVKVIVAANQDDSEYVSLYSESNAPEFYGLSKAVVQKDSKFDLSYAYLRTFAKDFEDGDLTTSIKIVSNNVDTSKIGNYEINYSVTDSDSNTTTLVVPIEVVDNDQGNYYERTIYSLPSGLDSYMGVTGSRGMYMDRQMTGFMINTGSSVNIKMVSGGAVTAKIYSRLAGSKKDIALTSEDQEISWTDVSTIFISTPYNGMYTSSVIGITVAEESLENTIVAMPYYHYGDDEDAFRAYWTELEDKYDGNTVGAIESEDICFYILPTDKPTGFKSFGTIDKGLNFYHDLFNEYDELLGYSYDATEPWNQNVKMKYFVTGGGANNSTYAYFTNQEVVYAGNSSPSSNAFSTGWAILHEIGHGYEGSGLKDDSGMGLLEVANNILGHYAQIIGPTSSVMSGDWLGNISDLEIGYNNSRLQGQTIRSFGNNAKGKLYVLVNLLDTYDYLESYSKLAQITREMNYNKTISNYTLADRYVLTYHELYGVNITSYFEAWGETISQSVKDEVKDDVALSILSDTVNDADLTENIKTEQNFEGKYSLVSQEVLDKYNITSTVKIHIDIDDINNIMGKYVVLTSGTKTYKVKITGTDLSVDVNIGTYMVNQPIPKSNIYDFNSYTSINVINNQEYDLSLTYTVNDDDVLTYDTKFAFSGQLGVFSTITFDSDNVIVDVNGNYTHGSWQPDTDYVNVKIYDESDNLVFESHQVGSKYLTKSHDEIPYKVGYKLVIFHQEGVSDGRYTITHTLTGETVSDLKHVSGNNTYYIGEYGLYQEDEYDYNLYLDLIDTYANKLISDLSESQIADKNLKRDEKAVLLRSIYKLKDAEKAEYLKKYNYLFNGSSPKLSSDTITLDQNASFNIYNLLSATDVEDGNYAINESNFKYGTIDTKVAGDYEVSYTLYDKDNNATEGVLNVIVNKVTTTTTTTKPTTTKATTTKKVTTAKKASASKKTTSKVVIVLPKTTNKTTNNTTNSTNTSTSNGTTSTNTNYTYNNSTSTIVDSVDETNESSSEPTPTTTTSKSTSTETSNFTDEELAEIRKEVEAEEENWVMTMLLLAAIILIVIMSIRLYNTRKSN